MKNVLYKSRRENQNTRFVFNTFFSKNHAVYAVMWKNMLEQVTTSDNTLWRMLAACYIRKAKRANAHSDAHTP
jgi:hypothetical protein